MSRPTRTDYFTYANADSETHHMRLTDVMSQEMFTEKELDKVQPNTLYHMNVSRNDHMTSWGYLILVNDNGVIENATEQVIETLLEAEA